MLLTLHISIANWNSTPCYTIICILHHPQKMLHNETQTGFPPLFEIFFRIYLEFRKIFHVVLIKINGKLGNGNVLMENFFRIFFINTAGKIEENWRYFRTFKKALNCKKAQNYVPKSIQNKTKFHFIERFLGPDLFLQYFGAFRRCIMKY